MGKKKRYIYTGDSYRQLALEPGDIRELKVSVNHEGGVLAKVYGNSEKRRSNLFYRTLDDFKRKWVEVS